MTRFRITTLTGTYILLFATCIALRVVLPGMRAYTATLIPPVGTVAGIGIGGTVVATPTNTLYEELQAQKLQLDAQAKSLQEREQSIQQTQSRRDTILITIIVLLATLIVINFYFDIQRNKQHASLA